MTSNLNKRALIIGANGTFGGAVTQELLKQGWQVKALLRDAAKCPNWLNPADIVVGHCESLADVKAAAGDVNLIVYGANPLYHQWHEKALKMLEPTAVVAQTYRLQILFPDNVYSYNPQQTPLIDETSLQNPVTDKGQIRMVMEQRLQQACNNGATVTLVRAGDFIARGADSSWFNQLLTKRKNGWVLTNPSPQGHCHNYVWIPDLAANAVALVDIDSHGFNVWHGQGINASHQDWLDALTSLDLANKSRTLPWWALKVIGLFHPVVREVVKMRYLWQQSLQLDGRKMQAALGEKYQTTSLTDVIRAMTSND
ncbi:MAG: nucleoside-diphosphate-sugar epimerase [Phenylobacterium sp.]|jgi:nucleoside-diphosphate-sugar epimerase